MTRRRPSIWTRFRFSPVWHNRDYLLLQGGQVVSYVGSNVQALAVPLLVLTLTGSPAQAGFVQGVSSVAFLVVGMAAGVLVDRWDRKRTMIYSDALRFALTATLPVALWLGGLSMPQIYLVAGSLSVLDTIFTTANTAALPNVLPPDQLPDGLRQQQTAFNLIRLVAVPLGGVLYQLGRSIPFVANAVSFAVSVVSLRLIRTRFQQEAANQEGPNQEADHEEAEHQVSILSGIGEGLRWLREHPPLGFLALVSAADNLRYGAGLLVIIELAIRVHTRASGIGAIFAAAGAGALLGNLASGWVRRRFGFGAIAISMLWVEALVFPLYAIAPNAVLLGVIAFAEETVSPIYVLALSTYMMLQAPDAMRGRMASTLQIISRGAQSLGAFGSGLLIESFGAPGAALCLGGWLIMLAIVTTLNPRVRREKGISLSETRSATPG